MCPSKSGTLNDGLYQHEGPGPVASGAPGSAGVRALSRGAGATDRAGHESVPTTS